MGPVSTGHLELWMINPNDNLNVTFNYFKEQEDVGRCIKGIETIGRVINSVSFSPFKYDTMSFNLLLNMTASALINLNPRHDNTSTSLEQYCKMTIWHYREVKDGEVVEKVGVVVNGEENFPVGGASKENVNDIKSSYSNENKTQPVPRVLPKDEDPKLVSRNRRMLGQLLGTLE
ncbi:hypothetical protein Droror1_Dr00014142 [Drosera rotundifolia]